MSAPSKITRLTFHSRTSKTTRHLVIAIAVAGWAVPFAEAVSTASASASLSFRVSSPNGPLGFSAPSLNGSAALDTAGPASDASYSNHSSGLSLSGSEAIGVNSASTASTVNGNTLTASSGVSLALPPFSESNGSASSANFLSLDTLSLSPVGGYYSIKFSYVQAHLSIELGNDPGGVYAFGAASWLISLRYSLPAGNGAGDANTLEVSKSAGTGGNDGAASSYSTSFFFSDIPSSATGLQLYWETSVRAQAVDARAAALDVPEGGSAIAFFALGLAGTEWFRRRLVRPRA